MEIINESVMNPQVFSVDMWLLYGSFAYGVECFVKEVKLDSLHLSLSSSKDMLETFNFVKGIFEDPKGLLRIELRIYGPEILFERCSIPYPLSLYTEHKPVADIDTNKDPRFCIQDIQGSFPSHISWKSFLCQT
jgi:hypothetical protein